MAFRDAHRRSKMTEADWDAVAKKLNHSYRLLHEALIGKTPSSVAISPGAGGQGG